MRILMAAKYGPHGKVKIGGVQSWITTLRRCFESMGHEVTLWEWKQRIPKGRFDFGIFAHWAYTKKAAPLCDRILNVSHGIIPAEMPGHENLAFTSEEVSEHWDIDGPIIRQPIDLGFWTPAPARRQYLTRFSYRVGLEFIPAIASKVGLKYCHLRNAHAREIRDVLRQSSVVIATGRGALEAMACGAPVVLADHRTYQEPLYDPDTFGAMERNYSGRGGMTPTPDRMQAAICAAMKHGSMRAHVEQYHGAMDVSERLLEAA